MNSEKAHDFQISLKRIKGQDARHGKDNSTQQIQNYIVLFIQV